jgi:hypothetical protein
MSNNREIIIESTFGELHGATLTGKTVECDVVTQILTTDKAVSIISADSPYNVTNFRILFPKEYEECRAGNCAHSDKTTECFTDKLQSYIFCSDMKVKITETIPIENEPVKTTQTTEMKPQVSINESHYGALMRETNRILPELFKKMIGSGGLSIDTDSMSLSDPRDRHYLEWLARITAGFVLEEQAIWEPQVLDSLNTTSEYKERTGDLERLLDEMRETADKEDVTVDELKELIGKYRNPLENHYDKMARARKQREWMAGLEKSLTESETEPESKP